MLQKFKIRGFKAVFSGTVSLGEFTLLIGRNGAGKSTAIEALQWLRDAAFLGLAAATGPYTRYAELLNRRSDKIVLDLTFQRTGHSSPVHYVLEVEGSFEKDESRRRPLVSSEKCIVGKTRAAHHTIRSRKGRRGPTYRWLSTRSGRPLVVRSDDELALAYAGTTASAGASDLRDFLSRAVFLRLSPTALAAPMRSERRRWAPILSEDGHDLPALLQRLDAAARARLVQKVRGVFGDVRGVRVKEVGSEAYFVVQEHMRAQGGTRVFDIPSWMLSEGMRRIVAIYALIEVKPRPSLIAIEEVENGLDPWTLEHLLQALREASADIQILLTTHSPFLLDHVDPDDVIHVRRASGDTTYEPVSQIEQVAKYAGVLAPGAMYLSNVFANAQVRLSGESGGDADEEDER